MSCLSFVRAAAFEDDPRSQSAGPRRFPISYSHSRVCFPSCGACWAPTAVNTPVVLVVLETHTHPPEVVLVLWEMKTPETDTFSRQRSKKNGARARMSVVPNCRTSLFSYV